NVGPWSDSVHYYYDQTAPQAPTNLGWTTDSGKSLAEGSATNEFAGTAAWDASSSSDINHYLYNYWNDITSSPYNDLATAWTSTAGLSLAGVFNQGEGVHYYCVMAVDNAGNK